MQKRWILSPQDNSLARRIAETHSLSPILAQILVNRSLTDDEKIQHFLKPSFRQLPDPSLMKGMDAALSRLVRAVRQKEKITIYGDYDVDGTTATALLVSFFQAMGAAVDYYIPHRLREGYSLNAEALQKIKQKGTQVIITVDNGISAVQEAEVAQSLGLDLIITDHHEPPPQLPQALAILNPRQNDDYFPAKELAGVGVAFYLMMALRRALREDGVSNDSELNLKQFLDLVALGTVADMAPLVGVNRILVREGLQLMSQTPRLGLRALMQVAGVDGEVSAGQIGFRLGPRINAAGRLDDASLGVRLLLSQDREECERLASELNQANEQRQRLEDQIVEEATAQIEREQIHNHYRSLVLKGDDWHPGVVGIVASRLVEKYHLPSIVLTRDHKGLKGSARSIRNFNLVEALQECADLLEKFGGHRYAAGLSCAPEKFARLVLRFDEIVRHALCEEDFLPSLKIDAESDLSAIDAKFLEELKHLEPLGLGNPEPLLALRGVKVQQSRVVGEKHLKLQVEHQQRRFGAIGFRLAEKMPPIGSSVDLAFSPEWNEWNGQKDIQLRISDLRCLKS